MVKTALAKILFASKECQFLPVFTVVFTGFSAVLAKKYFSPWQKPNPGPARLVNFQEIYRKERFSVAGSIGAGTIFQLGEQQLVKNSQHNQIQSITFEKKVYTVYKKWGIFENFCVKSNLTVCKVTFNC